MKINEIIVESRIHEGVEFNVVKPKYYDNGDRAWSQEEFGQYGKEPCWVCDGTGKDSYDGVECSYCKGSGETEEWQSHAPRLQVSNANASAVLDMLGQEFDYSGVIEPEQISGLMKKLMLLKNSNSSSYTQEPSTSVGKMGSRVDPETGVTHIGRGATIHDQGRSNEQVERYIDTLMAMLKFAQENQAGIGWS